ncbi:MAG TPA: TIGR04086 family membrane protein [Candidatus Bariatricus faecipullorum]|nr:TIGR04086 family membrane protein [Candidatus Bariatricus faecipullorum]
MEKKLTDSTKFIWILRCLLVSYVVTTVLLLLMSFLLYKFDLGEQEVKLGIMAVYVVSTFAGGFLLGKLVKVRRFLWGLILGCLYFLLLILISIGVYRTVQAGENLILAFGLCAAGGMLGGMVS